MTEGKGRTRTGNLYRRWKGKKYPVDDPVGKDNGVIYLRYMVAGKSIDKSLKTADIDVAKKAQAQIMRPIELANEEEVLEQTQLRLKKVRNKRKEDQDERNPPVTIEDAWNTYLTSTERSDTGEDTLKYYAGYWKKFSKWLTLSCPTKKHLREITPQIAQEYAVEINGGKFSNGTYNKHIGFLKMFFRVLEEPGRMEENPFERIRKKKLQTNSRRELTIAELREILEEATGDLQTLLYIGTFTGLRLGDCCTLKWGEVDLERGLVRRVPSKTSKNSKPVLIGIPAALHAILSETPPKKRKGYVIPRFAELYTYRSAKGRPSRQPYISNEIQSHIEGRGIKTHKEGTGYIKVADPTGKHEYILEYTGKRAVVEVGFHSLRHTYVSLHAEAGTPQAMIQANVGHSNPSMTAHYTHIGEDAALKAAGALNIGVGGSPKPETAPEPVPKWACEKAKEAMKLTRKITGKKNGIVAESLRELLGQLIS